MLTDIFAIRYEEVPVFKVFGTRERRVLHQSFTILEELHRYWGEKKDTQKASAIFWEEVHKRVSNELGTRWLSEPYYSTHTGLGEHRREVTQQRPFIEIVRNWNSAEYSEGYDADSFIKMRLSLVEIGLRLKHESFVRAKRKLGTKSEPEIFRKAWEAVVESYECAARELNERFRQGRFPLNYHNGFIQLEKDELVSREIEQPFWSLVSGQLWSNVDLDMKEALDQLDTGGKDPAFHAGKSLESTIKIISGEMGLTHGGERGAHGFIDNISKNSVQFLSDWEAEQLKNYFTKVRNPLGHGPGNEPMPSLTHEQSSWAIETAMSWIKLLVQRYLSKQGVAT